MSRAVAREVLSQLVFEYVFRKDDISETLNNLCEENKLSSEDRFFVESTLNGVKNNFDELTEKIKNSVSDFSFSQLFKVDYAILLIAFYEIEEGKLDKPIIINEALNLAKKYSTDKSPAFINGVLSSYLKGM